MNAMSKHGSTALMYAAANIAADVARLLIKSGADINAKSNHGMTALMLAEEWAAADVIALLKAAGAKE